MRKIAVVVAVAVALTVVPLPGAAQAARDQPSAARNVIVDRRLPEFRVVVRPTSQPAPPRDHVPGELIVRFRPGVERAVRRSLHVRLAGRVERNLLLPRAQLVRLPSGMAVQDGIAAYEATGTVQYAEPNRIHHTLGIPNDAGYGSYLWGMAKIQAPAGWDDETGSSDVKVAVIDTGVDYDHPDLDGNIFVNPRESGGAKESNGVDDDGNGRIDDHRGWDFVDDDNDPKPSPRDEHGTHVAGTIGAEGNNVIGVAGVNWDVSLIPIDAYDEDVMGFLTSDLVDAYMYAASLGADVANLSLGGNFQSTSQRDALAAASRTLFVAAAGNGGFDGIGDDNDVTPVYPCGYDVPNVLCVAATDRADVLTSFSNFGENSVDIAAPGSEIFSTSSLAGVVVDDFESTPLSWTTGGTATWTRTSERSKFGSFSLTDSAGAAYANNADAWVRLGPVDLNGKSGCGFSYFINLALPSGDGLYVEAATAPSGPWTVLEGVPWTGSTNGTFISYEENLAAFDGAPAVYLRFRLSTDASGTADGAWVDEARLRCGSATLGENAYGFLDGTSMATPHVAGAAALMKAHHPAATAGGLKAGLLATKDSLPSLAGKVSSGGRLNLDKALDYDLTPPANVALGGAGLKVPFQKQTSVALAWTATDAIAYELAFQKAKYNASRFGAFSTKTFSATSTTFAAAAGHTYCFKIRALDAAGNRSDFTSLKCTAVPVNNTTLSHSTGWAKRKANGHFLNTYSVASKKGAKLSLGVKSKRLALVASRCRGCGTVDVLLGKSRLKRISLAAATTRKKQIIPVANLDAVRSGTITIRVVSSGKPVKIEGLGASRD